MTGLRVAGLVVLGWALVPTVSNAASPQPGHDLKPGEIHRHTVEVEAGEALTVRVEQLGVDVIVSILDPRGVPLVRVDGPNERHGFELAAVQAETSGLFTLRIEATSGSPPGAYRWWADARRPQTGEERLRLRAELATARAGALYLEGSPQARRAAIHEHETALDLWNDLGETRWRARALDALAVLHHALGEPEKALERIRQALALWNELSSPWGAAVTLHRMGFILWRQGEHLAALEPSLRALELRRDLGDGYGEALTLSNLGLIYLSRGAPRQARPYFDRALGAVETVAAPGLRARILVNLGGVHQRMGYLDDALASFSRALPLLQDLGDRRTEAIVRSNQGVAYRTSGQLREALERFLEAREIFRRLGDPRREATALNNLGRVHADLGELSAARDRFEQALALRREADDRRGEAVTLGNLGEVWQRRGDTDRARSAYTRSLALHRELGNRLGEAMALDRLGRLDLDRGRPEVALEPLEQALLLRREQGARRREAESLRHLARAQLALGRPEVALDLARTAGVLADELSDEAGAAEARTLLARGLQDLGKLHEARETLERALERLEAFRVRLLEPGLRISRLATHRETYELYVDVLMTLDAREPEAGWHRRALETAERMRARGLLDLLAEAGVEIERGVSPELLGRRRSLERRWRGLAAAFRRRSVDEDDAERRALRDELRSLEAELTVVEDRIRRESPAYERLVHPETLSAEAMEELAGDEAVLLQILLGEARSFLWTVRGEGIRVFELPPRDRIEAAARRVHETWSRRELGAETAADPSARTLSSWILEPVAREIEDAERLAVAADGALHLVPWGGLPHPEDGEPLITRHQVVHLPSASVLALQRRTPSPSRSPSLAVWADPVFAGSDRAAEFARLPRTGEEAERIVARAPRGAEIRLARRLEARRETVTEGDLERFRILHFATHGILDDETPRRSGLALSMVDGAGRSVDGFLALQDVYDLELDADLVVLSGCRTALGRPVHGEGLVGLTQGFFHAGARRIVASLWPVEDRATAELMDRFYAETWEWGRSPADALRRARLELRSEPRWRDPRHWAAFILLGDWR